jgi:hypothetical protein
MKYKQLNTKHPEYDHKQYDQYNALYEGGKTFEKFKPQFLTKNEIEPPQIFKSRQDNAEYQNFVGPIIDQFAAQLFSSPFKITSEDDKPLDSFYTEFQSDVDGGGADLVNFMQNSFINAVVKGCSWFVAEMPALPDDLAAMKAANQLSIDQMDKSGYRRATLCAVDNSQVFDYEMDNYKRLSIVKIHKCESLLNPATMDRSFITETWKIYDSQYITTYVHTYKQEDVNKIDPELEIKPKSQVKHGFGAVPVLTLEFPPGLWIMNRVASAQIGHFRSSAQLDWAQRNCAFPMPVFKSVDKGSPPVLGAGRWILIDSEEEFDFKAPSSDSFASLAERIESKRVEIFRVTQQMAAGISNTAVIGRSADSKAMDTAATEICLQAYGRYVKEAVEEIFELVSNARGEIEVVFSVEGMNQFNPEDVTSTMANLKASKELVLHSPDYLKEIELKISNIMLPDLDGPKKDLITKQIEDAFAVLTSKLEPGSSLLEPPSDPLVKKDKQIS